MIPKQEIALQEVTFTGQPSYTYRINTQKSRVSGACDDLEAVRQAVYKIVNTERYDCPLYSWDYGVELADLIGRPTTYCMAEIERRIREALLQDDRIKTVYDFEFETPRKGVIFVRFKADTASGTIEGEKEVSV